MGSVTTTKYDEPVVLVKRCYTWTYWIPDSSALDVIERDIAYS